MPPKKISADVVTARAFVLVDDSKRERCTIETYPNDESGAVVLQLADRQGRPRITLQVDSDGNPSVALFTEGNVAAISLAINDWGNGLGVTDSNGVPCVEIGVPRIDSDHPEGDQPLVNVRDRCGRLVWSTRTLD